MHSKLPFWTKFLLIINGAVFLYMIVTEPASIMAPSTGLLLQFGAKDPIQIALGEWWRYFTPVFVHIGIIHFGFNNYALKIIGPQIESILGPRFFPLLYLLSGVAGNVISNATNLSLGAGASGALFGLIGAGLVMENMIRRTLPPEQAKRAGLRAYTTMAAINILLGFMVPAIDNAAHIGGMITGMLIMYALMNIRKNRLYRGDRRVGHAILLALAVALAACVSYNGNKIQLSHRFAAEIDQAEIPQRKIFLTSRALTLTPEDTNLHFIRGKNLVAIKEHKLAIYDLMIARDDPKLWDTFNEYLNELETSQNITDQELYRVLESADGSRL